MIFGALAAASLVPMTGTREVELSEPTIRVRDVIDTNVLSPRLTAEVADHPIARLSASSASLTLSGPALLSLVRRAVPLLSSATIGADFITFRVASATSLAPVQCSEAISNVASGATLWASQSRSVSCDVLRSEAAVRFDPKNRRVVAAESIKAGDYLGRVQLESVPMIERDAPLLFRAQVGTVVIERPVVSLQPLTASKRLFVRGSDGEVFSAPVTRLQIAGGRK